MIKRLKKVLIPLDEPSDIQTDLKCAGVLVPLLLNPENQQWQVIFTRRAAHLKHHPGQISFPGGRFEDSDITLDTTALRETEEEIGIKPKYIQLIGRLPQQITTSQYNMSPFVGVVDSNHQMKIDANEVAEVFSAPLNFVMNSAHQQKVRQVINGIEYNFYVIEYKHYKIWGATARILVNLSRRLSPLK